MLVPVKDAARTVAAALQSVRSQTLADLEVVVVDDHSTDETPALLAQQAAADSRLRLTRPSQPGLVAALNEGLALCKGRYIARMDADDVCHPTRLAAQVALLERCPDLGVASCLVEAIGHVEGPAGVAAGAGMQRYVAWLNSLCTPEEIARARFIESPVAHPSVLVRRRLMTSEGGYRQGAFPEDYDLWLRLLGRGVRFAKVPSVLLAWRDHPQRASRVDPRYSRTAFRTLKIQALLEGPLAARPPVIFIGAGIEGKPFLLAFAKLGVEVRFAVDLDPRKIGQRIHGAPVIGSSAIADALAATPGAVVLAAVGVPDARVTIRTWLNPLGLQEGLSYWFLC